MELAKLISKYDQDLYDHSLRVAHITAVVAEYSGLNKDDATLAGLYHDSGKLITTANDRHNQHPIIGRYMCRDLSEDVQTAILQHHERVDGAGYPQGLKGNEMSKLGKILAAADVFDKLRSQGRIREDILIEMRNDTGHFDKTVLQMFEEVKV